VKPLAIIKCENCGKDVEIFHKARLSAKHIFCSRKCNSEFIKAHTPRYQCEVCGKMVYKKPRDVRENKHITCSYECSNKIKKIEYAGINNHQYGLKGKLNASWKSDEKITSYGYRKIRVLDHPFRDSDDMVFEHRLVAEKYLLNDENSIEIDGKRFLRKDFIVHHKDHNRLNNSIDNLEVMSLGEHTTKHRKGEI
jgi:hypothetical protein